MSTTAPALKPAKKTTSPKAGASGRPKGWNVVQAAGGYTFVEKWGASGLLERFSFRFDDGDARRLARLLNRLDKE